MKKIVIPAALFTICLCSCTSDVKDQKQVNTPAKDTIKHDSVKSGKMVNALATGNDSQLNYSDLSGKRQGHWIITNEIRHLPGYAEKSKVEEGLYKDGKKEGEWTEYNADGSIRSKVVYKDDQPVK